MVRISIIIPSYNEEKYIGPTLRSIRRQGYKDVEVILADSRSTDGTVAAARKAYKGVKVFSYGGKGVARACNRAAAKAKGSIILFIDADTSISPGLLRAYDRAFGDGRVVAATGPIMPLEKSGLGMRIGFMIISVHLIKLFMLLGRSSMISSNLAVSARAFRKAKGFDEKLITYYDWDLSHRLAKAGRLVFVDDAVAYTSVRRVQAWGPLKYFSYHASNALLYSVKHKARDDYEPIR